MGKDEKEKAKQEKEEKARREKEEKEREKREKEEKEREKREKKEKKDQKEIVPEKPPSPHQPEKKTNDKPVVLKPISKPAETKPTPKPAAKPVVTSMPAKPVAAKPVPKPVQATPAPKPAEKPVVFKTKITLMGAKAITKPVEAKPEVPKPAIRPAEPKPVPKSAERLPTPSPIPSTAAGTQLSLPKWVPDASFGGAADLFTKKLGSGNLKGDEDAALFFKAMIEATKLAQWAKKKEQKEFAKYIAEDLDQYTDVAFLFEIRGWKEKYVLLFTPEAVKLGTWEGKFDVPPVNIGGIKVTNCVFFEMTPPKMLETMNGKGEEHLPIFAGEVTATGSVRLAQMFREWIQAFYKFIGQSEA